VATGAGSQRQLRISRWYEKDALLRAAAHFRAPCEPAMLRESGWVISVNIRADDMACRYGGDEFIIVLPGTVLEDARRKAEQLREQLKLLRMELRDIELPEIELSMGVAVFPNHGTSEVELLKSVDGALYRAKQEGGDRVIVAS
jgi:diguanylate cyclase (GGDEF)-like protein